MTSSYWQAQGRWARDSVLPRPEAVGLHWTDVDMDRGHVVATWEVTDAGKGLRLGAPKSASGARRPIDSLTADVLGENRERQHPQPGQWGERLAGQRPGVHTRERGATQAGRDQRAIPAARRTRRRAANPAA